jgi:hypothetical protein
MKIINYLLIFVLSLGSCFAYNTQEDIAKKNRKEIERRNKALLDAQSDLNIATKQKNMNSLKVLRQLQFKEKRV